MVFTITTIDGTTTEVVVSSSIGTITENYAPAAEYAVPTQGEEIGLEDNGSVLDEGSSLRLDKARINLPHIVLITSLCDLSGKAFTLK